MLLISILTHLVALVFTFNALCILCDEYLIPAVEVFIEQFHVPEEVAAVTLVAFGSAAPELFLNSVSAVAHTSDLSMSAIVGSGMIAFGLIPSLCMLNAVRHEMKLKVYPILRECGFYLVGLVIFLSCVYDGKIETNEAIAIVSVYLVYVVMVILIYHHELHLRRVNAIFSHYPQIASAILRSASLTALQSSTGNNNNNNDNADETEGLLEEARSSSNSNSNSNSNNNNGGANGGMLARISARPSAVRLFPGATAGTSSQTVPDTSLDIPTSSTYSIKTDRGTFLTLRNTSSRENSLDRDSSSSPAPPAQNSNNSNNNNMSGGGGSARYRGSPAPLNGSDSPADLMLITESSLSSLAGGSHSLSGERGGGARGTNNVFEDIESAIPATTHSTFLARTYELIVRFISIPIRKIFQYIMPTLYTVSTALPTQHPQYVPLSRAISVLLMCFLCISLSASLIVMISESLIRYMNIDSTVVGATLVAFGSEIPDALSAIALARNGYFDGAIAGALGSQVINISIGVGLPALIVGMTSNAGHLSMGHHEADSIWYLACLLMVVILSYMYLNLPIHTMYREWTIPEFSIITKSNATIQICVCLAMYFVYLYLIVD